MTGRGDAPTVHVSDQLRRRDLWNQMIALKQDIADVRTELKADIASLTSTLVRNTTRTEAPEHGIEAFRQAIRDDFESFRKEIAGQFDGMRSEMRTIKRFLGAILALMVPMAGGIIGIALRLGPG